MSSQTEEDEEEEAESRPLVLEISSLRYKCMEEEIESVHETVSYHCPKGRPVPPGDKTEWLHGQEGGQVCAKCGEGGSVVTQPLLSHLITRDKAVVYSLTI